MLVDIRERPKRYTGFRGAEEYFRDTLALGAKMVWEQTLNIRDTAHPHREMERTAALCPWCHHPDYDFVVSWPTPERPSKHEAVRTVLQLLRFVSEFCETQGAKADLTEHQILISGHDNTDNFHVHVAVNRVHPVHLHAVNINEGYDQKAFQYGLRQVEPVHRWPSHPNSPRYAVDEGVLYRTNILDERRLAPGQAAMLAHRDELPPQVSLEAIFESRTLGEFESVQSLDRFLQTHCVAYQAKPGSGTAPQRAFFVFEGYRVASSHIRDQNGKTIWTPAKVQRAFPQLLPPFTLGYPLARMPKRKRKSAREQKRERDLLAAHLTQIGRDRAEQGALLFRALKASHFVLEVRRANPGFVDQRLTPSERAKGAGVLFRSVALSPAALEEAAMDMRIAEDEGHRVGFFPARDGIVYLALTDLDQWQVEEIKLQYTPALIIAGGDSFSVLLALRSVAEKDTDQAALRLLAVEICEALRRPGLPPPPGTPLCLPGFRTTLGKAPPDSPPLPEATVVLASAAICEKASARLAVLARKHTARVKARAGGLFSAAMQRLQGSSPPTDPRLALYHAHLADLNAKATPPLNWEEIDERIAFRLHVAGLKPEHIEAVIAAGAPLIRPPQEPNQQGSPEDWRNYARQVCRKAKLTQASVGVFSESAPLWRTISQEAFEKVQAGKIGEAVRRPEPPTPEATPRGHGHEQGPVRGEEGPLEMGRG